MLHLAIRVTSHNRTWNDHASSNSLKVNLGQNVFMFSVPFEIPSKVERHRSN